MEFEQHFPEAKRYNSVKSPGKVAVDGPELQGSNDPHLLRVNYYKYTNFPQQQQNKNKTRKYLLNRNFVTRIVFFSVFF